MAKSKKSEIPKKRVLRLHPEPEMISAYELKERIIHLLPLIDEIYDGINLKVTTYDPNPKIKQKTEAKGVIPKKALEILAQQGVFEEGTLAEYTYTHRQIPNSPNQKYHINATTHLRSGCQVKVQMDYIQEPPSRRH